MRAALAFVGILVQSGIKPRYDVKNLIGGTRSFKVETVEFFLGKEIHTVSFVNDELTNMEHEAINLKKEQEN